MVHFQEVYYAHSNQEELFNNLHFSIQAKDKIAFIGNNGSGKTSLLQLIAGLLKPISGHIISASNLYYLPQLYGQYDNISVAQALNIHSKIHALKAILSGVYSQETVDTLQDDWNIEERVQEAFQYWQLPTIDIDQKMSTLSGGQKTKVLLAGIQIHRPELILLDEPSNHLDVAGRALLYEFIAECNKTLVIVSHDKTLLHLLPRIYEVGKHGVKIYGGNYSFYIQQKEIEKHAFAEQLKAKEIAVKKAKEVARASLERQQKLDARGKKLQVKSGIPTILLNTLRNSAEKSTAKLKQAHETKNKGLESELHQLRNEIPDLDTIKISFNNSLLHKKKLLIMADKLNFAYNNNLIWQAPLSFQVFSGDRIALQGMNGSGKTTLLHIILGKLAPTIGRINCADFTSLYIDQEYALIDNNATVYEQAVNFNTDGLQEHELKIILNRFLFTKERWNDACSLLSGGEKMRLVLCCLSIPAIPPDILILDEPTNNLDIQNCELFTQAIIDYTGSIIAVSHDSHFLTAICTTELNLPLAPTRLQ